MYIMYVCVCMCVCVAKRRTAGDGAAADRDSVLGRSPTCGRRARGV